MSESESENLEQMKANLKRVDETCNHIEALIAPLGPELSFNVLLNSLAKMIMASNNVPLVLGMALLGISQALNLHRDITGENVELDLGEAKDDRNPKSTH